MGCLNSTGKFNHWFANIHLSGPCNRSCYFCIGQHMMNLDPINILDTWPLPNIDKFVDILIKRNIKEVNITGSNTDPLLYNHLSELKAYLLDRIPDLIFGIRTNGALILSKPEKWDLFDKASISITSFNHKIYKATMGSGLPPNIEKIIQITRPEVFDNLKINVVLCPELLVNNDLLQTFQICHELGIKRVNLRQPYGQPKIKLNIPTGRNFLCYRTKDVLGNTTYLAPRFGYEPMYITIWDVHYTEVESINLYANGIISDTYSVTKGCDPVNGDVKGQENFNKSGRVRPQWLTVKGKNV